MWRMAVRSAPGRARQLVGGPLRAFSKPVVIRVLRNSLDGAAIMSTETGRKFPFQLINLLGKEPVERAAPTRSDEVNTPRAFSKDLHRIMMDDDDALSILGEGAGAATTDVSSAARTRPAMHISRLSPHLNLSLIHI